MDDEKQQKKEEVLQKGKEQGISPSKETAQAANQWRDFYNESDIEKIPPNKQSMRSDNPDENAPSKDDPPLWLIIITFGIAYLLKMMEQARKTTERYNQERPEIKRKCEDKGYKFVDEDKTNINDVVEGIRLYNELQNDDLKQEEREEKQKELEKKCKNSETLNNLLYSDKPVVSTVRSFTHGATMIAKTNSKTGKREFALIDNGAKDKIPTLCGFPNNEKIAKAGIDCFKVDAGSRMCMSTVREMEHTIGDNGIDNFVKNFCITTRSQEKQQNKSSFYQLASGEKENNRNIVINKNKLLEKKAQEKKNPLDIKTNFKISKNNKNEKNNNIINITNVGNKEGMSLKSNVMSKNTKKTNSIQI